MSKPYFSFITELHRFHNHVNSVVADQMDDLEDRFIHIGLEGKYLQVPLNADSYGRLIRFIREEIKEAVDSDGMDGQRFLDYKTVSDLQTYIHAKQDACEKWFVDFDYMGYNIINPFHTVGPAAKNVNPFTFYDPAIISSNWALRLDELINRLRVAALNFAQANDPNGCYTDEQHALEFDGELVDFETAVTFFIWYAGGTMTENFMGYEDAERLIKEDKDTFFIGLEMLAQLAHTAKPEVNYRNLWSLGIPEYKEGKFKIV